MAMTKREFERAEKRMETLRGAGYVVAARYDRATGRLVLNFDTGVEFSVPAQKLEGLAEASAEDLEEMETSPAGLGLYWPKLDVDVYVPALLQGIFGSRRWLAAQLGVTGGKAKSAAKVAASRENGRKGGRPRKTASA